MAFISMLKGIAVGAVAMYFGDPVAGRRRRSMLRGQCESTFHDFQAFVDCGVRDLNNRMQGIAAKTRSRMAADDASDEIIHERVQACMGHYVAHPRAVNVDVHDGCVLLSGPILADEVQPFLRAVASVRGVDAVENRLEVHEQADISSLQGGIRRGGQQSLLLANWAPGTRLLGAAAGLGMMARCAVRKDPTDILLGTFGFGLFVRAVTNQPPRQLVSSDQRGEPQVQGETRGAMAPTASQ